jgi:hypothetical protein
MNLVLHVSVSTILWEYNFQVGKIGIRQLETPLQKSTHNSGNDIRQITSKYCLNNQLPTYHETRDSYHHPKSLTSSQTLQCTSLFLLLLLLLLLLSITIIIPYSYIPDEIDEAYMKMRK